MILDGKALANKICAELKVRVDALVAAGIQPKLTIVTSGDDSASKVYVRNKLKRAEEIGIEVRAPHYNELKISDAVLEVTEHTQPIIFQMPTNPDGVIDERFGSVMNSDEDVDGFVSPVNVGLLAMGSEPDNYPCTPKGIMRLLDEYGVQVNGKFVCIIGRSNIVGRPLARMMEHRGATVALCHSKTPAEKLYSIVSSADIVVSATGVRNILNLDAKESWLMAPSISSKVFVDVGMNRDENGKLCGDIDPAILERSAAYTPVPGGVGPMTVAMLMENVVEYYERELEAME